MYPNRNDPSYIEAVLKKKSQEDPKETAIRNKIDGLVLRTPWARDAFSKIKGVQISYLKEMVANVERPDYVHDKTQEALGEISALLRAEIVEGADLLPRLPKGRPVLIMTNHFGAYKLTGVNPKSDLGVDIPGYEAMYPYLMYFAALYPVAQSIGDKLYYVSEDFPLVFGQIHTEAGFLHVPPSSIEVPGGRTALLQAGAQKAIKERENVAIVNFPEGGTSGKYSGKGPYDLDSFKTGGYVIAANLGINVIPVVQYFDKDEGFQLKVLKPFVPEITDKSGYERMAERNGREMQGWLDTRKDS